jgi:hypothetical protein
MQRLISLFKRPNDFEPLEPRRRDELLSAELKGLAGEPEYFVQLMDFLRDRNDQRRDRVSEREPVRCGAD